MAKVVAILELTSPVEENIEKWREVKATKYERIAVEVGARGFIAKISTIVWR